MSKDINVLTSGEVASILKDKEWDIIEIVKETYVLHREGHSSLPQSIFLRFPNRDSDRIIGLPAYIGGDLDIAGMKWISSFPENINNGMERASAAIILNDMSTGRVSTFMEASIISAKRTAGSAALAARELHSNKEEKKIGLVGCGRINWEILNFLHVVFPGLEEVYVFDKSVERAKEFADSFSKENFSINIMGSIDEVFENAKLVCFATTAGVPYISEIAACDQDTTILNISLRDFAPEFVEQCYNIVDDVDHVCRERTSIHLTEQKLNTRSFVAGTLADVVLGRIKPRTEGKPVLFSPFGLGVLDLALASVVKEEATKNNLGITIKDFIK